MIFLRSHIIGFGRLRERKFDFHRGFNLVFAPNEGGKSTLQRFLVGLLYGQLRSDLRIQRRLDPWVEQYKPWHGSEYAGILWFRLADGREMEIHRYFGKEETRIEIRSSTGENITGQYEQQRNGEVLFAHFHFGMPKDLFESVGMIRENKVAEIYGYETIRDRIMNLAQSGDEELSIRKSLESIRGKLDSIGSERAPTKPYRQAQDLVQSLRAERKAADERRAQFAKWIEDRNRLAAEIAELEKENSRARAALLSARRREVAARISALEEIENDRHSLRAEMESLGARAEFPAEKLEELNQLVGARGSIAKHLQEVRTDKEAAVLDLSRAESERRELAAYDAFSQGPEAEKITEWFVNYLSISLQKDGLQKTLHRLQDETGRLEEHLKTLNPVFLDWETDWQRSAREAAEDEQAAALNCAALGENVAREKSALASMKRTALSRRIVAGILLCLIAVPPALRLWAGFDRFSFLFDFIIGGILALAAGILFYTASKSACSIRKAQQILQNLEAELGKTREEGGEKRKKLNEAMNASGFKKLDDFLAAAKRAEQDRRKLMDLRSRSAEAEQQRDRLRAQSDELYGLLKEGLAKVGLPCSPGNLKFQIDLLRANLRRFRELDAGYQSCVQKVDALESKDLSLTEEYTEHRLRIQSLLDQAKVKTPGEFRTECSKRQKLLALTEREASRTREFGRVAGDFTLPQWRDKLQELMEMPVPQSVEDASASIPGTDISENGNEPYLPYLPTQEAEEREKQIESRLSQTREEYARVLERIGQAFQNIRSSSEIDEDLAVAEHRFLELELNRQALGTALETLENLSRQQQEVLAPQLNAAVEQRFLRICPQRYGEVKIDPDFKVWVREIHTAKLRPAEHLSRGTQDQLYFAMRFGILDLISNEEEPCPALLDEPFAAYDRTRLSQAFEVLSEEAGRRQLILFTCREDLLDLALKCDAKIIDMDKME
jgi:uncharacterized protein YhaN